MHDCGRDIFPGAIQTDRQTYIYLANRSSMPELRKYEILVTEPQIILGCSPESCDTKSSTGPQNSYSAPADSLPQLNCPTHKELWAAWFDLVLQGHTHL